MSGQLVPHNCGPETHHRSSGGRSLDSPVESHSCAPDNLLFGCFAAKNVILAGVKAVTVYDMEVVTMEDLGAQFYLTADDIGQNRAAACKDKLQDLNPAVSVTAATGGAFRVVLEHLPGDCLNDPALE